MESVGQEIVANQEAYAQLNEWFVYPYDDEDQYAQPYEPLSPSAPPNEQEEEPYTPPQGPQEAICPGAPERKKSDLMEVVSLLDSTPFSALSIDWDQAFFNCAMAQPSFDFLLSSTTSDVSCVNAHGLELELLSNIVGVGLDNGSTAAPVMNDERAGQVRKRKKKVPASAEVMATDEYQERRRKNNAVARRNRAKRRMRAATDERNLEMLEECAALKAELAVLVGLVRDRMVARPLFVHS